MQTVNAAFTAEERDSIRSIAHNLQISWKKQSTLGNRTFTIGVSTIGGNDVIGVNPGAVGSPSNYRYFDETDYVNSLGWERGYNMPSGGLFKALAEAKLDNTSGRFTPRYMGGRSELYTAILPSRPMIMNAGLKIGGVPITVPQFAGSISKQPAVNARSGEVSISGEDYVGFFEDKYLDQEVMFTAQRTDQVMQTILQGTLGMNTAQYDLDTGINIIPFGLFESGTKVRDIFSQLAQAENGHFYQDESGIFKFENRQHWDNSPYTQVQRVITTAQVLNAEIPDESHLINVVEVRGKIWQKQPTQIIFSLSSAVLLPPGDTSVFFDLQDPMLAIDDPTFFTVNTLADGEGTDSTSSVSVKNTSKFSKAIKITFTNSSTSNLFLTDLRLYGRPAKAISNVYYRGKDDSSVTAYQEHPYNVDNIFIQNETWAKSLAQMILNDFSNIENIQKLTIRAIPELQLGDLISWQGRYWRVFEIKAVLNASQGFTQQLTLLQRTIVSYFRIGISTIGGADRIAP